MARATISPDAELRAALDEALAGRRVVLTRGSVRIAIVPQEDLEALEELDLLEDELDDAEGAAALAEFLASGEKPIPADEVFARLGLD